MKRYDFEQDPFYLGNAMSEADSGDWVRYEDVRSEIQEARDAVAAAEEENFQLRRRLTAEITRLKSLMRGWDSYAWKDGQYIDSVQGYFDEHAELPETTTPR